MKILYIECKMGVAGDMLMSALYEIIPNQQNFLKQINSIFHKVAVVEETRETKCGIVGTRLTVKINGVEEESEDCHCLNEKNEVENHNHDENIQHTHNDIQRINYIIQDLNLSEKIKSNAKNIFESIANAESKVHNADIKKIHFHEVGEMDAVVDIIGSCIAFEQLAADKIIVSPINLGSGFVKCAHGILPVPAPATAEISKGMVTYSSDILGELATPTGVAIIKHFADEFACMPNLKIESIGYGMGKKNFEVANCVRVFFGGQEDSENEVAEITCNIDDMTSEEIGFSLEMLLKNNPLDVFTTPIYMKKNRPAFMLSCICESTEIEKFSTLMLKHTTTLGVRFNMMKRKTLNREIKVAETSFGQVRIKVARGEGISKTKIEYDDLAKIATERGLTYFDVKEKINEELGILKQ